MKNIIYILSAVLLLSFSGCDGMLDIQPVNSMIPKSVQDFESVIVGGYPKKEFFLKTEYMTDNVYANFNTSYSLGKDAEPWFVWASSHQLPDNDNDGYWGELYKSVYYANSILDEFKEFTPTSEDVELFEIVKGEAYALRAYAYFYLVNFYAENYETANFDKPGVPMPLTAVDVHANTQNNVRVPVKKVWEQICKDLDEATPLLAGKPSKGEFRFNYNSLQAFKGRVYLFMGEWDKAIAAATDVIGTKSLFDMNTLQSYIDGEVEKYAFGGDYGFIDSDYKKEVLLFLGGKANYNIFYYDQNLVKPAIEILELCKRDNRVKDYRKYIFDSFLTGDGQGERAVGPTVYRLYGNQGTPVYYIGLKLSEAYVTRAEAYMRQATPDKEKAIRDLNELLKYRIQSTDYVPLTEADFSSNDDLLKRVLEERRVETAFDCGLRWMDLRRLGKPEIKHIYKNGTEYTLKQGDLRYVLQIPMSEQKNSPNMPINPR